MAGTPDAATGATRVTSRRRAFALLALGNSLWAGTYAAGKIALGTLSFAQLNALRFSIATAIMIPVLWSARSALARELSCKRSLRELARLVLLGFVLNKAFEYAGLSLATAVDVALLIATESVFTAALSWIVLDEPVTIPGVAALLVGLAGAYLIVARGVVPDLAGPGGAARIAGDLMVVLALLFEAFYTIGGKSSLERVPPLLLTSISVAGSLLVWIPAATAATLISGIPTMSIKAWLALGYMAAFATVIGYWSWFRALSVVNASEAAPFLFIQPLLGAALGVIVLGETMTWATIAGAALILMSLAIVTASAHGPREAAILVAEPPQ